ncbi:MAG: class I SAM-dependent methyltransferase [Candidatus Binatia bacterium]
MTTSLSTGASNAEQIAYWNEVGGPKWVRYQALLDHQLDAIGHTTMEAAAFRSGDAVIDVGCGCGSTTLEIASRVNPGGRATGIDISRTMLELARDRARAADIDNAAFLEADAQAHDFQPEFDVLFSRFGVMFFDDPTRAFTNLRRSLKPGGRLAFACWQAMHRNPWMTVPMMAALKHVTIDAPPNPEAPGPFAFADATRVDRILGESGFKGIDIAGVDVVLTVGGGGSAEEAADFLVELGPLSRLMVDAPPELRHTVTREVRDAIAGHAGPDGVKMAGAVWIVTAKA